MSLQTISRFFTLSTMTIKSTCCCLMSFSFPAPFLTSFGYLKSNIFSYKTSSHVRNHETSGSSSSFTGFRRRNLAFQICTLFRVSSPKILELLWLWTLSYPSNQTICLAFHTSGYCKCQTYIASNVYVWQSLLFVLNKSLFSSSTWNKLFHSGLMPSEGNWGIPYFPFIDTLNVYFRYFPIWLFIDA